MVPHTFLDGIWYSIGHPLHAKLTCQAQKVVQFFFPHLCLPEVDEVHHSCQGGVSESPHEDDRVRLVNLEQQVFEERTRGSEDHLVGIEPLSIFTGQSDIREVNGVAQIFERRSQVCLELVPLKATDFRLHPGGFHRTKGNRTEATFLQFHTSCIRLKEFFADI